MIVAEPLHLRAIEDRYATAVGLHCQSALSKAFVEYGLPDPFSARSRIPRAERAFAQRAVVCMAVAYGFLAGELFCRRFADAPWMHRLEKTAVNAGFRHIDQVMQEMGGPGLWHPRAGQVTIDRKPFYRHLRIIAGFSALTGFRMALRLAGVDAEPSMN